MMDQDINADVEDIAVSFCIPVYNVAPWIEKCIDSIVAIGVSLKFEIICVDDCSTDESYRILEKLAKNTKNMIILRNEKNRGVSFTRNTALSYATGEYIWFVDPDDMINPDIANFFYLAAKRENADMAVGNYNWVAENDDLPVSSEVRHDYKKFINDGSYLDCCGKDKNGAACTGVVTGIYRRALLIEKGICFNEKLSVAEDIMFNFDILRYASVVLKYESCGYYVRKRRGSSSSEFNEKRNKNTYVRMYDLYNVLQEYIDNKRYSRLTGVSSLEQLKLKQYYTQENVVRCLAMVRDRKYIREQLSKLKLEKIYPYKFRRESLSKNCKSWLVFLLPVKLDFWFVHFLYGFKKKNYQHHENKS